MRAPQRPATHEVRGPTVPVLRPVDELCLPLGEALRVLLLRVDTLLFAGHPNSVDEELRRVRMLATEALLALRRLKDEVDGAVVDGASLDEVLRHLTSRLRRQTDACLELCTTGEFRTVPARVSTVVARMAREVLVEVERNARASVVLVSLAVDDSNVVLEVKDDGVDLSQRQSTEWGSTVDSSISTMARLTKSLGGRFRVYPGRRRGLCLQAVLPLEELAGVGSSEEPDL